MYVNGDVKDDLDETLTTCINREFEKLKKIYSIDSKVIDFVF